MRVLMVACDFSPQIVRALGDGAGPVPVGAGGANGLLYSGGHIGGEIPFNNSPFSPYLGNEYRTSKIIS